MEKRREKGIQYKDLLGCVVEDASVGQMSNHDKSVAIHVYHLVLLVACHYLLMWLSNTFMIIHK
jgi:hypothetical protein